LGALRRLIANGDMSGIPLAEAAIEEYWAATPAKARKSGLLYIQQILHDQRGALSPQSRHFAVTVDAYIEKKRRSKLTSVGGLHRERLRNSAIG
jgi:hypothetical protein